MNLPSDPIDLAVLLRREMSQCEINEESYVEGVLPNELDFEQVLACLEQHDMRGPSDNAASRKLEFSLPPNYFLGMEQLLRAPGRRVEVPADFYVEELDYRHSRDRAAPPEILNFYLQATQLFRALAEAADDERRVGSVVTLVFLGQQKLEVNAEYAVADLQDLPALGEFKREYIASQTHKQQKSTIMRAALLGMFSGKARVTFSELLAHFPELVEHVESSYQLYVSEFSFQKVKAEVEKEKLEFTAKLNKVFSDIQNQLLAVPAALILVGGQMESSEVWGVKNLLVWFGAMVFAVLMNLLIRNQRHTLNAVKLEIDQQWQLIEGKHRQVAAQFKKGYERLDERYKHQEVLLGTVSSLVAIALGFATVLLLWYSVPKELALQSLQISASVGGLLYIGVKLSVWLYRWRQAAKSSR